MKNLLLLSIAIWFTNCASQKVTVSIDIYQGETEVAQPRYENVLKESIDKINSIKYQSGAIAENKKRFAESTFRTFEAYQKIFFRIQDVAYDPNVQVVLLQQLDSYKEDVDSLLNEVIKTSEMSKNEIAQSMQSSSDKRELVLYTALDKVGVAFYNLSSFKDSDFNRSLSRQWFALIRDLDLIEIPDRLNSDNQFRTDLEDIKKRFNELALIINKGNNQNDNVGITTRLQEFSVDDTSISSFKGSVDILSNLFASLPEDLNLGNREKALADFTRLNSIFFSQLERLQDPADPIWKEIAKEENESKWSTEFTKSVFEAQGNSSVVLVRDSPISFRPQQANNDPSGLIESQLQISRAVTGAAISIAGAFIGIEPPASESSPETNEDESFNSVVLRAEIEEKKRIRNSNIRALERSLQILSEEMEGLDPADQDSKSQLLNELETLLSSYLVYFKNSQ